MRTLRRLPARRRPRVRWRPGPGALAAGGAVAAGLAIHAAFPPLGVWPLAPLGVAVLALCVRGRSGQAGLGLGLAAGTALMIPLLAWTRVVGADGWLALAMLQALFFAPLGAGLALVGRLPGWPLWSAALWVAQEAVRDRVPLGGFPWGRLAFAQTDAPFLAFAALGGAPLVTFATALAGGLVAAAVLAVRGMAVRAPAVPGSAVPGSAGPGSAGPGSAVPGSAGLGSAGPYRVPGLLGAVAAIAALGVLVPVPAAGARSPGGAGATVAVAVVQGNVPRSGLDFFGQREAVLNNHIDGVRRLAAAVRTGRQPRPDLVILPENASDIDLFADPAAFARFDAAVREVGVPVLLGALVSAGRDEPAVENRGIVWDPRDGPGDYYTKRHLVPFGEYVPFRSVAGGLVSRLDRVGADKVPGDRPGVLRLGPVRVGDVICFEVAYDEIVRDAVRAGGQLIVVQTNNATFGRTGQPEQQLAMSRLRAVEHGRAVAVAATSGISAIIAPDGRVVRRAAEFTTAILPAAVPAVSGQTLATRFGAAPEWALTLCAAGTVALCLLRRPAGRPARVRRRRSPPGAALPATRPGEPTTDP